MTKTRIFTFRKPCSGGCGEEVKATFKLTDRLAWHVERDFRPMCVKCAKLQPAEPGLEQALLKKPPLEGKAVVIPKSPEDSAMAEKAEKLVNHTLEEWRNEADTIAPSAWVTDPTPPASQPGQDPRDRQTPEVPASPTPDPSSEVPPAPPSSP